MKKEELIAKLEGAKEVTSVVSIDLVLAALGMLEPEVVVEKEFKLTPELAEDIASKIERSLDYNSRDLIDVDSAEFELTYDNRIQLNSVDVNMREIMDHVTASLENFVEEEEVEEEAIEELEDGFIQAQNEASEEGVLRDIEE
jgi:hypothetical protein